MENISFLQFFELSAILIAWSWLSIQVFTYLNERKEIKELSIHQYDDDAVVIGNRIDRKNK